MQTLYIISGPLGVGKTTVAKEIATQLADSGQETALIEGDVLLQMLTMTKDLSWEGKLEVTWENIVAVTRNYLQRELTIVLDYAIADELGRSLLEIRDFKVVVKYVVLLANEKTINSRLAARGELKYLERSLALLAKLKADPLAQKHAYDTTSKSVPEIAAEIIASPNYSL